VKNYKFAPFAFVVSLKQNSIRIDTFCNQQNGTYDHKLMMQQLYLFGLDGYDNETRARTELITKSVAASTGRGHKWTRGRSVNW
jgi:hypothetical protein